MERSQMMGAAIMAVAAVQMLAFVFGVLRRSYLAIALPISAGLAVVSALAFWVGWTMMTTEPDLPELDFEEEQPASQA